MSGAQTITGSANLLPENIKEGVNIFGKVGTVKPKRTFSVSNMKINFDSGYTGSRFIGTGGSSERLLSGLLGYANVNGVTSATITYLGTGQVFIKLIPSYPWVLITLPYTTTIPSSRLQTLIFNPYDSYIEGYSLSIDSGYVYDFLPLII